jgi:O-antigen/teichoic acid export membrane protein
MALYDRSKARRSLFDTITYRGVSQLTTVLGYVVLVRAISKEDFGLLNLLYSFIPLVGTAASLGLEQTLRRFQPEYLRVGNLAGAAWLVRRVAALRFVTNLVILGLVLLVWKHVAPRFDLGPYRTEFGIFSLIILLYFQTQVLQLTLAAHMLHRFSVGSIAMLSFVKLTAYSILAFEHALTLRRAIYADLLASALVYVFLRIIYRRKCRLEAPSSEYRPAQSERKRLLKYGAFNNFNDAGTLFLDSRIDNFFIAAFMNPVAVGIYSFYMRLNEMALNLLPGRLFDNIIQPMFFAVKPAQADERVPQYFTFLLNTNLLMLWPVLTFCTAYHAELVRVVFGGKFAEQSWLLPLIVGFATINNFSTPVALVAQYEEKPQIQLLSKVFAIYNVIAMLVLVPSLGLYGAALAIGSSQILKNAFVWWHVRRRAVWLNAGSSIAGGVATWAAVAALCFAVKAAVPAPAWLQLGFGVLIIAGAMLLWIRGPALCGSDRAILVNLFQGREARLLRVLGLLHQRTGEPAAS